MTAARAWAQVALGGLLLASSGCAFLLPAPLTPEQRALQEFRKEARANMPDLTGRWEIDGSAVWRVAGATPVLVDVRHSPSNRAALVIAVSPDGASPRWSIVSGALVVPQSPGEPWKVVVETRDPERRPTQPGMMVKLESREEGALTADTRTIQFGSYAKWTRSGDVGALALPLPGTVAHDVALEAPAFETHALAFDACKARCATASRCAALVVDGPKCRLLSSTGTPTLRQGVTSWVNPDFGKVSDLALPGPGALAREVRLTGVVLETRGFTARFARRECEKACENNWSCVGYTVETWDVGECRLLSQVTGVEKASAWESQLLVRKAAVAPAQGSYARDVRLTGPVVATLQLRTGIEASMEPCITACTGRDDCDAVSYLRSTGECRLHRELGAPEAAQAWTAWRKPPPPPDLSKPPDQTMKSPLCQQHLPAHPPYSLTPTELAPGVRATRRLDVPAVLKPDELPLAPPVMITTERGVPWTTVFYFRPLPNGLVHLHSWYQPEIVLKRDGDRVVVGPPDEQSEWRLEGLFEYTEPPATGVWIVIRHPGDGRFLTARGDRVELGESPLDAGARWRYDFALLPTQTLDGETELPLLPAPPSPLDPVVVNAMTDWAMKELARQELPACWKPRGKGPCPPGQGTNCGLFCAKSTEQCVLDVVDMTISVGEVAGNVGGLVFTGGAANAAMVGAKSAVKATSKGAAKVAVRRALRTGARAMQARIQQRVGASIGRYLRSQVSRATFQRLVQRLGTRALKNLSWSIVQSSVTEVRPSFSPEEQRRVEAALVDHYVAEVSAQVATRYASRVLASSAPDLMDVISIVDPTGVVSAVQSFNKPKCTETPFPQF